jgi:malate dehydrogenase (oxaloacetate-decarboxylating)
MSDREELRKKEPSKRALRCIHFIEARSRCCRNVRFATSNDFAIWYTPGVAASSRAVERDRALVYEPTNRFADAAGAAVPILPGILISHAHRIQRW